MTVDQFIQDLPERVYLEAITSNSVVVFARDTAFFELVNHHEAFLPLEIKSAGTTGCFYVFFDKDDIIRWEA